METGLTQKREKCGSGYDPGRRIIFSISILSALFFLDVLTTQFILSCGGVEYNPFMAGIVQIPIVHVLVKMLLLILVILVAKYSEIQLKGSGTSLFFVIIGWFILCVGNNLGFIVSMRFVA
ncbi:MAG: DUF5658 family protein [Methanoregula sp.]|nr:DUF5658 family protein [Methanoregula sp.]